MFENNVIVDLTYKEGQKVVFFPIDGQLGQEFTERNNLLRNKDGTGGYLDPEKRNIKAIKLRGERSEGLVLPIEVLSPYVNIDTLKTGDTITTLNGNEICSKYIPKRNPKSISENRVKARKKQKETASFPLFMEHADTSQLAYSKVAFHEGDHCTITLKMNGTSGRTSYTLAREKKEKWYHKLFHLNAPIVSTWKMVSGSRRRILDTFEDGYYGSDKFRKEYHDFFTGKLQKNESVYYEIVGYANQSTPIMGRAKIKDKEIKKLYGDTMVFSYDCEEGKSDIYVYRMTLTNEDGYVVEYPYWLMKLRCEQMGCKVVPLFEEFTYTTWEDLMERVEKYYDGADPIGKTHIREGIVVRIENRQTFKAYKHKNFTYKLISGIIADSADSFTNMSDDVLSEL